MRKLFTDADQHTNRRADVRVLTINLDKPAVAILRQYCPEGSKHIGTFLGRLLYEHQVREETRQEERARLQQESQNT